MQKLLYIILIAGFHSILIINSGQTTQKIETSKQDNILVADNILQAETFCSIDDFSDFLGNIDTNDKNNFLQLFSENNISLNSIYAPNNKHLNLLLIDLPPPFKF